MNTDKTKVSFCMVRGMNDTVAAFVINGKICSCTSIPYPYATVQDDVQSLRNVAEAAAAALNVKLDVVDLPRLSNSQRWTDIGMSYDDVKKYITDGVANFNKAAAPALLEDDLPPYVRACG